MAKQNPVKGEDIKEHMEILGSDGEHVGVVDHLDVGNQIKMTKKDPNAGGKHHFIPLDWVSKIDEHVHLNKSSEAVTENWRTAA